MEVGRVMLYNRYMMGSERAGSYADGNHRVAVDSVPKAVCIAHHGACLGAPLLRDASPSGTLFPTITRLIAAAVGLPAGSFTDHVHHDYYGGT